MPLVPLFIHRNQDIFFVRKSILNVIRLCFTLIKGAATCKCISVVCVCVFLMSCWSEDIATTEPMLTYSVLKFLEKNT